MRLGLGTASVYSTLVGTVAASGTLAVVSPWSWPAISAYIAIAATLFMIVHGITWDGEQWWRRFSRKRRNAELARRLIERRDRHNAIKQMGKDELLAQQHERDSQADYQSLVDFMRSAGPGADFSKKDRKD